MARDDSSSGRSGLGRLIDRLLGRDRPQERSSRSPALFTANQPPPSDRRVTEQEPAEAPEARSAPTSTTPAPQVEPAEPPEPDLFEGRPGRTDAWEEPPATAPASVQPVAEPEPEVVAEPTPEPAPEPPAAPDTGDLQTAVHEDALDQISPRPREAPGVRVHDDHLEQRSGPVQLTPSQALELARGGRDTLRRRDRD